MVTARPKDERVAKAQEKAMDNSLARIALLSETLEEVEKTASNIAREANLITANAAKVRNVLQAHVEVLRDQIWQMQKAMQTVQNGHASLMPDP